MQVGIDMVSLNEFQARLKNISSDDLFSSVELEQNPRPENLAGVFAAKEALMKALGRKLDWLDIRVDKLGSGQPVLACPALAGKQASLSISHDGDYCVAVVVVY